MLAGAMSYVALIALVAATILSAGLAMTRMSITRMTQPYLAAAYTRAVASVQQTVAAQMQAGGIPYPAPSFTPIPAACADASCTYTATATISLLENAAPTAGPSCDPLQTNCAANVQTNGYVGESRVTALVTAYVRDRSGAALASRSGTVVLRTMAAPPYAAIAGTRDAAFDDLSGAHALGDDGGSALATADPCASDAPGISDDTRVRVAYRNQTTNACTDGSSWAQASYSGAAASGWAP